MQLEPPLIHAAHPFLAIDAHGGLAVRMPPAGYPFDN
jgi:hypothetical protein